MVFEVQEAGNPSQGVGRAGPAGGREAGSGQAFPWLLRLPRSLASRFCRCRACPRSLIARCSPCVSVSASSSSNSHHWIQGPPLQHDLVLTAPAKTLCPSKATFTGMIFLRDTIHPHSDDIACTGPGTWHGSHGWGWGRVHRKICIFSILLIPRYLIFVLQVNHLWKTIE